MMLLIKKYRVKANLSQKELAKLLGISTAYLCELETGKKRNPSITLMIEIAEILNVSLEELTGTMKPMN